MDRYLFEMKFKLLISGTTSLPFVAFIICVVYTMVYTDAATDTHCSVYNFAPSISASIGLNPQRFIWQTCIALHSAPRFLFASLNANHLRERVSLTPLKTFLIRAALVCQWLENFSLLSLSIVTSSENFPVHKTAFSLFVAFAFLHMTITIFLISDKNGYSTFNLYERRAVTLKQICYKVSIVFSVLMLLFYWRHNTFCEPYVYSFFCMSEYVVVLANMAFHMTAFYDFYISDVIVSKSILGYQRLQSVATA